MNSYLHVLCNLCFSSYKNRDKVVNKGAGAVLADWGKYLLSLENVRIENISQYLNSCKGFLHVF
jgi:hypothetical protein